MSRRERLVPHAVALFATIVVLAPLAAPGYVLSYDLVFVPRQPLRWELVAPALGLPRAVPQDAVVSLLSLAVPGWLLERVALVAVVYVAAWGAGRIVPARRPLTRAVAALAYAWSPFLAERLLLGQWGLLLAYATLPWLVAAAIGVREGRRGALPRLIIAAAPAALTPTGGLIALAVTAALTLTRRRFPTATAAVLVLNAPWLVAAVTTAAGGRSDPAGVAAFAVRGENWSGPLGAVLGTGGIWNSLTTPASRASPLVPVVTLVVVAVAVAGFPLLRRAWPAGAATRLALVAAGGLVVALAGATPGLAGVLEWAVGAVPGAGLLRDGHKFLAPYALLLALGFALGVERITARFSVPRARAGLVAAAVLPIALMPDLAFGGLGQLRPVSYPADWDAVAAAVAAAPGEVLALPFSEYRRFAWNNGRIVIDPAPRYLDADVLTDDTLRVGDIVVAGENPRAARVRALLAAGRPVIETGVRWVLVARDASAPVPPGVLAGLRPVVRGEFLELYESPSAAPPQLTGVDRRWLLASVDLLALAVLFAAIWRLRGTTTAW